MANKKAPYELSGSSLVNLKAELYRKQEEFKKRQETRAGGEYVKGYHAVKSKSGKTPAFAKSNKGVADRIQQDRETVVSTEEKESWEKAKSILAAKAKLYDKLAAEEYAPDDGEQEHVLIDFSRKAQETKHFSQQKSRRDVDSDSETSDEEMFGPVPLPNKPDEEWVEYEDYLGRSRKCLKKDLKSCLAENEQLRQSTSDRSEQREVGGFVALGEQTPGFDFGQAPLKERTLMSEDMLREKERLDWEETAINQPVGPVHYQTVENGEIRNLGVGYFKFSTDEETRVKEMEELKRQREQTLVNRKQKDQLKAKRKALLDARLSKIRERKNIAPELSNKDAEDEEMEFEKMLKKEKEVSTSEPVSQLPTKPGSPHIRPWDKGKVEQDLDQTYVEKCRDDRNPDFAPPSAYSVSPAAAQPKRQFKKYSAKQEIQRQFEESELSTPVYKAKEKSRSEFSPTEKPALVNVDYQPWEHVQPWKMRAQEATHTDSHTPSSPVASAQPFSRDEARPWAYAPPPAMYSEPAKPMVFHHASEAEIRAEANRVFSKR